VFFVTQVAFRLGIAVALAFVAVKLTELVEKRSRAIMLVVHANFWGSVITGALFLLIGGKLNMIAVIISALIYVYLLRAVGRIEREANQEKNA
jgi:hypothetical protein